MRNQPGGQVPTTDRPATMPPTEADVLDLLLRRLEANASLTVGIVWREFVGGPLHPILRGVRDMPASRVLGAVFRMVLARGLRDLAESLPTKGGRR